MCHVDGRYSTKEVVKLMEEIGFPPSIAATFQVLLPKRYTVNGGNRDMHACR